MTDPGLEALWTNVLEHWEDDRAHGAFLEHCQTADQLVEAAVRYRGMSGDRDRSEAAKKRLEGVAILALARLEATRTERPRAPTRAVSLILVAFFAAATAALLYYLRHAF